MTRYSRFPSRVYRAGEEPDPRFSLANERTFLAWMRTALGLFATGVALEALQLDIVQYLRESAAAIFILLGIVASVHAWLGWMASERALRSTKPLPGLGVGAILFVGIAVAMILVIVGWAL